MNAEFNEWWDGDLLTQNNPFEDGTPAYWAWEGWCAAVKVEREACAMVCEELLERPSGYQGTWEGYGKFKTQMTGQECAAAIRARGQA